MVLHVLHAAAIFAEQVDDQRLGPAPDLGHQLLQALVGVQGQDGSEDLLLP